MKKNGFTLLETLAVVAMTGILAASAFNGYSRHLNKKDEAQATKLMYEVAQKLEHHRSDNFTYEGFTPVTLVSPEGATGNKIKYNITIRDGSGNNPEINASTAVGREYIIRAVSTSSARHSYLYTSTGKRCKNKTSGRVSYTGCGTKAQGASTW